MANILIVEDEPRMRRLLEISLGEDGHSVHSAEDAEKGTPRRHLKIGLQYENFSLPAADLPFTETAGRSSRWLMISKVSSDR